MNWIGTYLLLGSVPLLITGILLVVSLNSILQSMSVPLEAITPITNFVNIVFYNLIIYSAVFSIIGLILLFVKFAFKKEEPTN